MNTRRRWILAIAAISVLVAAMDTYVIVLALPAIMADVGIGIDQLQAATPIVSGFLLGYVVVMPLLGRLSDLYGRRPLLLLCLAVFAAGSFVTASASDLGSVVAGRAIQGLGGGGLVPVTLALVADLWPPERRSVPLGVIGAVQELGSVLGPLYGGLILTVATWQTIFWLNLPIAGRLRSRSCSPPGRSPTTSASGSVQRPRSTASPSRWPGIALGGRVPLDRRARALVDNDTTGLAYSALGRAGLADPDRAGGGGAAVALILWELAWSSIATRALIPVQAPSSRGGGGGLARRRAPRHRARDDHRQLLRRGSIDRGDLAGGDLAAAARRPCQRRASC